jgi:hypothetical protein
MKCAVVFFALLAGSSLLLGDTPGRSPAPRPPSTLLEDLARMTRAGTPDATVLLYAKAHRRELPPEVSDAQLRWLRDSGVGESVVRYMAAIDVRISGETRPEGVTYGSSSAVDDEGRPRAPYRSTADDDRYAGDAGDVEGRSAEAYAGSGYADNGLGYDYDSNDDFGYGYPYYPYFGDPFPYSAFPAFFFIDRGNSFRRFPRRDHRDHRDHRFDGGHRRRPGDRGDFREAWRERGARARGGSMSAGIRGSGRPAFARGGYGPGLRVPGPRGHSIGPRGLRAPGPARAGFPNRFRGAPGGAFGHRDFSRGGFSSAPPSGRGLGRGPVGGGRSFGGSGGRGRH